MLFQIDVALTRTAHDNVTNKGIDNIFIHIDNWLFNSITQINAFSFVMHYVWYIYIINLSLNSSSQLQSASSKAPISIKLTGLVTKQLKQTKQIELQSGPPVLQLIDGQLWCGLKDEIQIYSTQLRNIRGITLKGMGSINGIAEVDDDKVAVAASDGLVLINKKGDAIDFCQYVNSLSA